MPRDTTINALHPTRGGMIAPGVLRMLAESACSHGTGSLLLTARQEIVVPGLHPEGFLPLKHRLPGKALWPWRAGMPPNIVTSCAATGSEGGRAWLREGVFADILAGFQFRPAVPVSIADPAQREVPASLGVINFLAADEEGQWYVQLALADQDAAILGGTVSSSDIPETAHRIQSELERTENGEDTFDRVQSGLTEILKPAAYAPPPMRHYASACNCRQLDLPHRSLTIPALGGRLHGDCLEAICRWAMENEVPNFGITPWKTLVMKRLSDRQHEEIQRLLVHRRVHTEQGPWRQRWYDAGIPLEGAESAGEGLRIALNQSCPIDTGMSVAVIRAGEPVPDVHIIVRQERAPRQRFRRKPPSFTILVRDGFNARASGTRIHAEDVTEAALCNEVLRAVESYAEGPAEAAPGPPAPAASRARTAPAFRCGACYTEYREDLGDPLGGVTPGTSFGTLPETWACPTCGESRAGFEGLVSV